MGFAYMVADSGRQFIPPWRWPSENSFRSGGILDASGKTCHFEGVTGFRKRIPVVSLILDNFALGGLLFAALYGDSFGPDIKSFENPGIVEFKKKTSEVIFKLDKRTGKFADFSEDTNLRIEEAKEFSEVVEAVRWHIDNDGGELRELDH